jgi:hypothetical protein
MDTQQNESQIETQNLKDSELATVTGNSLVSENGELNSQSFWGKYKKKFLNGAIVLGCLLILAGLIYKFGNLVVVASVDGHVITRFSVISELEKQGGKDALELLINKQLVNKAASDMNIVITDSDIDPDIKRYEDQFSANGGTLDESLAVQGMTRQDLRDQIEIQKKVEKILGDKVNVTDEEIAQYMKDNSITPEAGKEQEAKEQIKEGLKQEKLSEHSNQLLADLRAKAKVNTFIKY